MTKRKNRKPLKKEEIGEDYCFVCKDGGELRICDYKQCPKAYHFDCVGKDKSFLKSEEKWTCNWHSCLVCHKASEFHCYYCPKAVCLHCIYATEFVNFKGKYGFCRTCLQLALLVEEGRDVDSDGEKLDFTDCETIEGLFKEYHMIIQEKEGFNVDSLRAAKDRLRTGNNFLSDSDSGEFDDEEDEATISDYDVLDDVRGYKPPRKKKEVKAKLSAASKKGKSNVLQFCGWGSMPLIKFLKETGRDTEQKLSQFEVSSIISTYVRDHNLYHPGQKRKIVCDEKLRSIFGKKTLNRNRIYELLEAHFAENLEESEEEEDLCYSADDDFVQDSERRRESTRDKGCPRKEAEYSVTHSSYASISKHNINLVFLRRSLVQELSKHPASFKNKIIGSIVRVKTDPNDFWQKNTHQLVQVAGVKEISTTGDKSEIILFVTNMAKEISISLLSDATFSEEECQDLRQKVKDGLIQQPTVVELQKKARILHQDITKDWIAKELKTLDHLIDLANEKGRRKEYFTYLERKKSLQSPSEQARLLEAYPTVIPEATEIEGVGEDAGNEGKSNEASPQSDVSNEPNNTSKAAEGHTPLYENPVAPETNRHRKSPSQKKSPENNETKLSSLEEWSQQILTPASKEEKKATFHCDAAARGPLGTGMKQNQQTDAERVKSQKKEPLAKQVIELCSSDEEDHQSSGSIVGGPKFEDTESKIWMVLGPDGERKGPYSLSVLHRWTVVSPYALKFQAWKRNQSEADAISLVEAVNMGFPPVATL